MPRALRFCSLCGRSIVGSFVTYRPVGGGEQAALVVCPACEASAPRCRSCGRPMAAQPTQHSGPCASCLAKRPRCETCGQPIATGVRLQDGSQRAFCQSCAATLPCCLACGAPVDSRARRLSDGRVRCPRCDTTAVDDPAQAQELYGAVQRVVAQKLGLALAVPTELVPVDRSQLEVVLASLLDARTTEQRKPHGIYARQGMRRGIYVELGLPRAQMAQVMAHEWAHAWQVEHLPLLEDPLLVEGFAEWVAYRVLEAFGETAAMHQMLARQDIYGQGLRHMLAKPPGARLGTLVQR